MAAVLLLAFASCTSNPVLNVTGGHVRGISAETPGITVYKGIPYAAPPVGELRWKAPQPVVPWEGILEADHFGPPSWQNPHTGGDYTAEFFFDGDPAFSEDCLYLNVWTPAAGQPEKKLPVTLWIHGGAYVAGWGSEPEMDGEEWARHGGVLVTFTYRLGLLGFLAHPALSAENPADVSGNYGMLDQIAALKWVQDNIAAFGGDPDHITLMGQSAGAMSVQTLVTSPLSKGMVAGAIIQSGGVMSNRPLLGGTSLLEVEQAGKELMDWACCKTLEQMRAMPAEDLLGLTWRYMSDTKKLSRAATAPVLDGYVLPETFTDAALGGRIADIPYLVGSTLDDMGILADGIETFCALREKSGKPAYAYQFARRLPTDGRPDVLEGAFHSSELWYMFNTLRFSWRPFTEGDRALAEQMITAWTNFARSGDPNGECVPEWEPCTKADPRMMVFRLDEDDVVASSFDYPLK